MAKMKQIESAGIAVLRKSQNGYDVLMGHATQRNPLSLNDQRWGILKGKVEEGENIWDTAKREFKEESGFEIHENRFSSLAVDEKGKPAPVITYSLDTTEGKEKVKKKVHVYVVVDKLKQINPENLKCTTLLKDNISPEIDGFAFVDVKTAPIVCMQSQSSVFNHLKNIFEN
jgi:predicted NUDIX family NTP pyrophosphohydrolase